MKKAWKVFTIMSRSVPTTSTNQKSLFSLCFGCYPLDNMVNPFLLWAVPWIKSHCGGKKQNQSNPCNQQSVWDPWVRCASAPCAFNSLHPKRGKGWGGDSCLNQTREDTWSSCQPLGLGLQPNKKVVGSRHHRHLPAATFYSCHLHLNEQSIQAFSLNGDIPVPWNILWTKPKKSNMKQFCKCTGGWQY